MMPDTKKVADAVTGARLLLSAFYIWLGLSHGGAALPLAGWLLLANWSGDSVDGALARRSRPPRHTWIGDHDLQVDMSVATGLLVFLIAAGLLPVIWGAAYLLLWAVIFMALGLSRSLGMLAQAPVYGWFILTAIRHAPLAGWSLVAWILVAVVVTWPRFPQEVVPGFLRGLRDGAAQDHPPPRHHSSH
jgi:hypothetical protein